MKLKQLQQCTTKLRLKLNVLKRAKMRLVHKKRVVIESHEVETMELRNYFHGVGYHVEIVRIFGREGTQ